MTPTFLISHAAQRYSNSSTQCRARSNKHFKTVFSPVRTPVLLLKRRSSHSVAVIDSVIISENSTDSSSSFFVSSFALLLCASFSTVTALKVLTSYNSPFALFRDCCVVVEFHSSHSFTISRDFDVIDLTVRFVSCLLCCCRVSLQPQFHSSFS